MKSTKTVRKLVDIPIAKCELEPGLDYKKKAVAAEPTGKGDTLIVDLYFGRMFRSSVGCVTDELNEFSRQYQEMCQRLDEDPAGEYYDVLSYNDLYYLHGLMPGIAQGEWGWTNTEDYRTSYIEWDTKYVDDESAYELVGEPYFAYKPKEFCEPFPGYMEV